MSDFHGSNRPDQSTPAAAAHTAQEKAAEGARLVSGQAAEVAGTAKEQAANVAGEAKAQAQDLVSEVRTQLQDQAQTQTKRLATNVRRLADELQEMSENGKPESSTAGAVRKIADGGHQVAARLENRGPDGLFSDLQNYARRRPGVFLAGAALAGFAVARLGKDVKAAGSGDSGSASGPTSGYGDTRTGQFPPDYGEADYPVATPTPAPRATGYATDPLDSYGQSQPPHVVPDYAPDPPTVRPPSPPVPPLPYENPQRPQGS